MHLVRGHATDGQAPRIPTRRIAFRTETWTEAAWSCTDTNRVSSIDDAGHIYYGQNCVAAGKKTVSKTPTMFRVIPSDAAAIAPGTFVVFRTTTERGCAAG